MVRSGTQASGRKRPRPGIEEQSGAILRAAVKLFGTRGTAAVSVSDIAKAAGVSRDTFYRCFDDKEALLQRLYTDVVSRHMQTVMAAPDLDFGNPEWVSRTVDQTVDAILAQAEVAGFLFVESGNSDSPAAEIVDRAFNVVARRMRRWLASEGVIPPPLEYFKALLVAAQWLVHSTIRRGARPQDIKTAKQAMTALYIHAFSGFAPGK